MREKEPDIKFICDEQLGKLARWLRILGQDVIYKNRFPDNELVALAQKDSRIILTRDSRLAEKAENASLYLVAENYPYYQIREVVKEFRKDMSLRPFTRCADCNVELKEIPKTEVKDKVPPFVYKTQEDFRTCPSCGRIFWSATHMQHIKKQIQDIIGDE